MLRTGEFGEKLRAISAVGTLGFWWRAPETTSPWRLQDAVGQKFKPAKAGPRQIATALDGPSQC
eukprot:388268-Prymnesium_polylepis.1